MNDQLSQLNLALKIADLGYWDFDPNITVLNWSPRAKEFFGLYRDQPITYVIAIGAVHPDDRKMVRHAVRRALSRNNGTYDLELRTIGIEDGIVRHIHAKGIIKFDKEGHPLRIVGILSDKTEQRRRENELIEAKAVSEAANDAKSQFLANMSHEIRTPLGAILGFAELAQDSSLTGPEICSHLSSIKRNGDLLTTLVNQLLDLSKVEANKIDIERIRVNFSSLLEEIMPTLRMQAEDKGLRLYLHTEGPLPLRIETDPTRFKQILNNIVGNAIKFTETGRVDIIARVVPPLILGKRIEVEIEVKDTGIGMEESQREEVFERFKQADNTVTRKYGGSGLGLALAKDLAEALGGNITLTETAPGKGSTFVFNFEDTVYESATPFTNLNFGDSRGEETADSKMMDSLDGVRVLLVEDSPDIQLLLSRFLKAAGAQVDVAEDGVAALDRTTESEYDVVLMDIQMPKLDGYSTAGTLRDRGYTKPIIALTAHAMVDEKEKCLNAGFNDHMTKPINRRLLIKEVATFAARTRVGFH